MSDKIELDSDMWANIKNMILSDDRQSSNLAFGILQNINPNDESSKINFDKLIEDVKEKELPVSLDLNKLIYVYHMLYSKN